MWSIMSFKSFKSLGFKITIHLSDIFSYYTVGKLVKFFSGSQIPFGNPISLEIPFHVTQCITLSAWPGDNDCEVELRRQVRSQMEFGNETRTVSVSYKAG
jgi:hypothetical protein